MSRPKKSYKQRLQLLKKFAKRLTAYSAAAAATVVSMHSTANAEEKVWDILDISGIGGTFNLQFNMISGGTATNLGTNGATYNGSNWELRDGIRLYAPNTDAGAGLVNGNSVNGGGFGTKGTLGWVYPDVLSVSSSITADKIFGGQTSYFGSNYGNYGWLDNAAWSDTTGVVGVQFNIGGSLHYGWAQVTVAEDVATLHGFGYNKVAGAASHAVDTVDVPGDINRDGVLDDADWIDFVAYNQTDLDGLTREEAYRKGDLDFDLDSDIRDFDLFRKAYDDANGAGAFAAMTASVPEPSSIMLLAFGAAGLATWRRRRED